MGDVEGGGFVFDCYVWVEWVGGRCLGMMLCVDVNVFLNVGWGVGKLLLDKEISLIFWCGWGFLIGWMVVVMVRCVVFVFF